MSDSKLLEGISILLVEDEDEIRKLLSQILAKRGCKIYEATNGKEGLEQFVAHQPDIVVSDIQMPQMTGLEMVAEILTISPDTPTAIVTAFRDERHLEKAIELGVDKLLFKPISSKQLIATIEKMKQRIELQREIFKERQYYQALMTAAIVSKTDPEGLITDVNDNFCKAVGYSRDELIGKNHNLIRHPDMPDHAFKGLWETITQKKIWNSIVKNRTKDGKTFIANSTIVPMVNSSGEITEYVAIRQDVTDIELLKNEVEKQENIRLVSKTREEFLVIFTHELKTPLNAIINFSEYVKKSINKSAIDRKKKLVELLDAVNSNAHYMLENIINILDVAKLRSGKLEFRKSIFCLSSTIDAIVERNRSLLDDHSASISVEKPKECLISSDELRARQIITNIYTNAIKYGNGKIDIELKCEKTRAVLSIDDDGAGIAGNEKLFDLFEQSDDYKMVRASKGTGVGLFLVKLLCDGLGILYSVEKSEKLGGTRFVLTFGDK